jgi:fermentation-respiration switch protein FrsA (DUF1100 family)
MLAPIQLIGRLAPTPLLLVTGVDDQVHAIDEVLEAYERAREPKRLELLEVDEFGLSIEPGLGQAVGLAAGLFDQQLRRAPRFVPSPTPRKPRLAACAPSTRRPPAPGEAGQRRSRLFPARIIWVAVYRLTPSRSAISSGRMPLPL